jgi:hypothetical protein
VPVLSFAWLKFVLHMCVGLMGCDQGGGGSGIERERVGPIMQMGQLTCSTEQE